MELLLPHQNPPSAPWGVWLVIAGRGAGKSYAAAHWGSAQECRWASHSGLETTLRSPERIRASGSFGAYVIDDLDYTTRAVWEAVLMATRLEPCQIVATATDPNNALVEHVAGLKGTVVTTV